MPSRSSATEAMPVLAPAAMNSASGSMRIDWSACGVLISVSSPASTTSGPSAAASAASAPGGRRFGKDDVDADRLGAGLAQRLDQPGMQAARPGPLQADLGERGLVDGDDDGPSAATGGGESVER